MDFKSILKEVENKQFKPLYLLHGEEPYYIDIVSKAIQDHALEEHERDFNQVVVYGKDAEILSLISEAKGFPMMAERRLVIVREAQDLKDLELLESYCAQPNPTTVFVFCHKYKKLDARSKVYKEFSKNGLVFLSDKVKDYHLSDWISNYLRTTDFSITPKASMLLAEFLGNDLSKITNELDKLALLLQKGTTINEVHIEENIGISKDFNFFELSNAVRVRDVPKAMQIVYYFNHNPKAGPLVVIVGNLFGLFSNLMRVHFSPNKSHESIAQSLRVHPFVAKELIQATKIYPPKKISANISILHEYDLKSKGLDNPSFSDGELLQELVFKLMH
jgi:DNA polymerase-3 subunit delta